MSVCWLIASATADMQTPFDKNNKASNPYYNYNEADCFIQNHNYDRPDLNNSKRRWSREKTKVTKLVTIC